MKKIGIVAIIFFATIPFFAVNPVLAYVSPGKPTGFVNDFASILSTQEKADLETTLSNFQKQSGNEITIVTVPSLGGETVQTYAVTLFKEWGIGKKGKDNGLLILHAPNERQIWIEVGYGLEPFITDAKASSIYRNILSPAFKKGNYAEGYTEAVTAIIATLNGQVNAVPQDKAPIDGGWGVILYFILFIPIWLGSILARSKSWWTGGVIGGIIGISIGIANVSILIGILATILLIIIGLVFDFLVSRAYSSRVSKGMSPPWWIGGGRGGRGGFGGGGFGGFGGGGSGGGGGGGGY